jgi:hypothetical protein
LKLEASRLDIREASDGKRKQGAVLADTMTAVRSIPVIEFVKVLFSLVIIHNIQPSIPFHLFRPIEE